MPLTNQQQRELVLQHLTRREEIKSRTKEHLDTFKAGPIDPLEAVDSEVRQQVEDEFYGSRGRRRYITSDGRTMFLRPDEIEKRRHARSRKSPRSGRKMLGLSAEARS